MLLLFSPLLSFSAFRLLLMIAAISIASCRQPIAITPCLYELMPLCRHFRRHAAVYAISPDYSFCRHAILRHAAFAADAAITPCFR